ncbi:MAG: hypothetical protein ACI4CB_05560 [Prevotella sp.]
MLIIPIAGNADKRIIIDIKSRLVLCHVIEKGILRPITVLEFVTVYAVKHYQRLVGAGECHSIVGIQFLVMVPFASGKHNYSY